MPFSRPYMQIVFQLGVILEQAVRLSRRHNMPPPHLDFWPFDLEVGVGVAFDLGYPCAKFRLPRSFGFRVRADVRDIRQTDRRTTDADHRLMSPPPYGRGHNNSVCGANLKSSHVCFIVLLPINFYFYIRTHISPIDFVMHSRPFCMTGHYNTLLSFVKVSESSVWVSRQLQLSLFYEEKSCH